MNKYTYNQIPEHMMAGLKRYLENGILPGGFLTAVIENDLFAACDRADDININLIPVYVKYLYTEAPSRAWGYKGAIDKWRSYLSERQ